MNTYWLFREAELSFVGSGEKPDSKLTLAIGRIHFFVVVELSCFLVCCGWPSALRDLAHSLPCGHLHPKASNGTSNPSHALILWLPIVSSSSQCFHCAFNRLLKKQPPLGSAVPGRTSGFHGCVASPIISFAIKWIPQSAWYYVRPVPWQRTQHILLYWRGCWLRSCMQAKKNNYWNKS